MGAILSTVAAVVAGGVVATVTVVSLVSSQTATPEKSPVSVNGPVIEYGSNA